MVDAKFLPTINEMKKYKEKEDAAGYWVGELISQ
ncbi:hypothetical protein V6Z12_D02G110100 [Gossypium hirsutum]